MRAYTLWLCILLGVWSVAANRVSRDGNSVEATSHSQAEAEAATYLAKTNGDAVARESEIHPFRSPLKHQPQVALEKTEQATSTEGAGGGAAVAGKPELMRYFERAQAASKNAGRRQQEQKMKAAALKRAARQEKETPTPIPVSAPAVAVEEAAVKVELPKHPHLLAFYLEQLADQAAEQAQRVDAGEEAPADELVLLDQVASTGAATTPDTSGAATTAAATGPATTPTTPSDTAVAADTAAAATGPATPTPTPAADTASAATGDAATGDAGTGGATPPVADASTGIDEVTNSVVPLSHLEQLQKDLAAVEAEHAARQAALNAELKKQQEQTKALLEQEKQGTVGLTVTPVLINPEKHLPIDPANADLYNKAPTDDKMNIKPSVFRKSGDLIAEAEAQHVEFKHNMPIECAEPTCTIDQ